MGLHERPSACCQHEALQIEEGAHRPIGEPDRHLAHLVPILRLDRVAKLPEILKGLEEGLLRGPPKLQRPRMEGALPKAGKELRWVV